MNLSAKLANVFDTANLRGEQKVLPTGKDPMGFAFSADGKTARQDNKTNPALFAAPHAMTVDSRGDFYVVEWVDFGRPRKFKHTPQEV